MRKKSIMLALITWLICFPVYAQQCTEHDFVLQEEPACCTEPGYTCYVCTLCGHSQNYQNTPMLGHDMGQWVLMQQPSCTQLGLERRECSRCGEIQERDVPMLEHTYEPSLVEPTCKEDGYTLLVCSLCSEREKTDVVAALGHDYQATVTDPTCTADGYTRHVCSRCDDAYRTDTTAKLGHEYGEGVETREPTLTTMGRLTYTCIRCDDSYTETTPKWTNPFLDLDKKAYYFNGVLWACNKGITTGTTAQTFGPDDNCTRAQVVTFLWRQAGQPVSDGKLEFSDIPVGAYYYDAVRWAVEQGITNGVSPAEFAPDRVCTRCEVVTFLYRAKGGSAVDTRTGFVDVASEDYFYDPVYWAYFKGITTGTGTGIFSPYSNCTRAQIVTFLYRARNL